MKMTSAAPPPIDAIAPAPSRARCCWPVGCEPRSPPCWTMSASLPLVDVAHHVHLVRCGGSTSAMLALLAETTLAAENDGLSAIGGVELAEDVGDVVADGLGAEDPAAGDGLVVEARGDELEDVVLALGRLGEGAGGAAPAGQGQLGHGVGHVVVEDHVAGGGRPEGVLEAVGVGALDEVTRGAV